MKQEIWIAQDRLSGWQIVSGPYTDEKSAIEYVTAVGPSRFKLLHTTRNIQTAVNIVEGE